MSSPSPQEVWKAARWRHVPCPHPFGQMIACSICTAWMESTSSVEWFHRRDVDCDQARRSAELWTHSELQLEKD
jgi:hypothetical protein